jgi:hypothetical protein
MSTTSQSKLQNNNKQLTTTKQIIIQTNGAESYFPLFQSKFAHPKEKMFFSPNTNHAKVQMIKPPQKTVISPFFLKKKKKKNQ